MAKNQGKSQELTKSSSGQNIYPSKHLERFFSNSSEPVYVNQKYEKINDQIVLVGQNIGHKKDIQAVIQDTWEERWSKFKKIASFWREQIAAFIRDLARTS